MSDSRLSLLQEYYTQDPSDPFNIYALALETSKTDASQAITLFEELLNQHPQYLPTYYHAGKLYESLKQTDQAITVYKNGISLAQKTGDLKTARELKSALDELEF